MPTQDMVHLHVHTQGSFAGMKQDGVAKSRDMIHAAAEDGFSAIALTDHGNMIEIYDAYTAAKEHGVKLIPGMEVYHVFDASTMREKTTAAEDGEDPLNPLTSVKHGRFHLTLLGISNEGLRNLFRIHEESWQKNFYYKPNTDFAMLKKYSEGVVCLTGCPLGMIQRSIRAGRMNEVISLLQMFHEIFGDRLYAEVQRINMAEFDGAAAQLADLADQLNIKKVASNDVHFIRKEDNDFHDIAICINKGMRFSDPNRKLSSCQETYLKSTEEMLKMFPDMPEAVTNTLEIAERCKVDFFAKQNLMPTFPAPAKYKEEEPDPDKAAIQYFKDSVKAGFSKVFPKEKWTQEYIERVQYEVKTIIEMNYHSYHLIVADFIQHCKKNGIPIGPGRGSAAGSIVCASLGITDLDPIEHGLIFERYLNPGRKSSPPDIDTDVAYEFRQKVIDYVRGKYGVQRVAVIGTTGTFKPRMALKDVGRALCLPDSLIESVSRCIPEDPKITFKKAIKESEKFKAYYDRAQDPKTPEDYSLRELFKYAFKFEGNKRHVSKHAAGVVIMPENAVMSDFLPMMADQKDKTTYTGLGMYDVEAIGLLKMDFLGLKTLDRIEHTLRKAGIKGGYEWLKKNCDREDQKVYDTVFNDAQTIGIFQFEKEGMRNAIRQIKADRFSDLVMIVAAMRPGPKEFIPLMADCKHGLKTPEYDHPDLEPVLRETYGVILYQEQALEIFRVIFGFTLTEADLARRAIGKKKADEMEALREKSYEGAVKNGYTKQLAEILFAKIEKFAEYAFNKCISGDTLLSRGSGNDIEGPEITVRELYKRLHSQLPAVVGRTKSGGEFRGPCVVCENKDHTFKRGYCRKCASWLGAFKHRGLTLLSKEKDGRIRPNKIVDVYFQGIQSIYRILLENGMFLDATEIHKTLTKDGEKTTKEMSVGDMVCVNLGYEPHVYKPDEYRTTVGQRTNCGFINRAFGKDNCRFVDGGFAKLTSWTKTAPDFCETCGAENTKLERAHLNGDRTDNEKENLKMMCISCHKKYDYEENDRKRKWDKGYLSGFSRIVSIEYIGEIDTYDVEMSAPNHNFVANGIVTHNSHAAGYALLSFHTAWCKTYYPEHYMAECFNYETFDKYKLFVEDCVRMGIPVLPADVSYSKEKASVEVFKPESHKKHLYSEILHTGVTEGTKCVRLGFQLVKGVGGSIALHKRAPYTDIFDFVTKNREVDAGSFEALIKGGAFDGFGLTRHELMLNLESLLSMRKSVKESNVEDVFASLSADERSSFISLQPCKAPVTDLERMDWESEYLGFCFTTNFYTAYSHLVEKYTKGETIGSVLQADQTDGDVAFLGLVYSAKPYRKEFVNKETQEKEKKLMLFLKVGDFYEQIEVGVFEDGLRRSAEQMQVPLSADLIRKNDLVLVIGSKKSNGRFNTTRIEVLERR